MPGTTVQSTSQAAGVECPADDPDWAKDHNCNDREHQPKCLGAIYNALGV